MAGTEASSALDTICKLFQRHQNQVLEIEIIGPGLPLPEHQLILQDGLCVGIPKKTLARAFIEARTVFGTRHDSTTYSETILQATTVILLFDPEHLTAANFRKAFLTKLWNSPATCEERQRTTQHELNFLSSILTSPLHRQSKSPTLWYHRYWLVSNSIFAGRRSTSGWPTDMGGDALQAEVLAVLRSAERHAHNYYAWQYLRRLLALRLPQLSPHDYEVAHESVREDVLGWVLRHPSDVSGWSCLSYITLKLGDPAADSTGGSIAAVEQFADSVGWKGQGLRGFLVQAKGMRDRTSERTGSIT